MMAELSLRGLGLSPICLPMLNVSIIPKDQANARAFAEEPTCLCSLVPLDRFINKNTLDGITSRW